MKKSWTAGMLLLATTTHAQTIIPSVDSMWNYIQSKSIILQTNQIREQQANRATFAAKIGVLDPSFSNQMNVTDNLNLPVSLFPAETFGGTPGTFKEIQTGIQYNTTFSQSADIKLINFAGWENLKLARINILQTRTNSLISQKTLRENLAAAYYNVVGLQEQWKSTQRKREIQDSLLQIVQNKYDLGWIKQQDLNDSKVALLNTEEALRQIGFLLEDSYLTLKKLADIPEKDSFQIWDDCRDRLPQAVPVAQSVLNTRNMELKEQYALRNLQQVRKTNWPSLSLVYNEQYQQFNQQLQPFGSKWYHSNSLALKLSLPMPNASSLAKRDNARFEYQLAQKNRQQSNIQSSLESRQLQVAYDKAYSQFKSYETVLSIQQDSYQKNQQLFAEGLLSPDQLFNSLTVLTNAAYNLTSARMNVWLAHQKILINNQIK